MTLSPAARAALPYFGAIQEAVSRRANTTGIWDAIKADPLAVTAGAPLPSFQGVNELRALAAAGRNAGEALGAALETERRTGLAQGIDSRMMSYGISSRDQAAINAMAQYHARFEGTFNAPDGSQFKQWLTVKFDASNMPATAGALADALAVGVPNKSIPAGATLSDIGAMTITVV